MRRGQERDLQPGMSSGKRPHDPMTLTDREAAQVRRAVKRALARKPSEADLTAFRAGLEEHQRVVELVDRHLRAQVPADRRVPRAGD